MGLKDIAHIIENDDRNKAQSETFGHLAPKMGKVYKGHIIFALGDYGDHVVIDSHFPECPGSPWFFSHEQDFTCRHGKERGQIYRFDGTYEALAEDMSDYSFKGKVRRVRVV